MGLMHLWYARSVLVDKRYFNRQILVINTRRLRPYKLFHNAMSSPSWSSGTDYHEVSNGACLDHLKGDKKHVTMSRQDFPFTSAARTRLNKQLEGRIVLQTFLPNELVLNS